MPSDPIDFWLEIDDPESGFVLLDVLQVRFTNGIDPQSRIVLGDRDNRLHVMGGETGAGSLFKAGYVYGGAGQDVLRSDARTPMILDGGSGNDVLHGSAGAATLLIGGTGDDTFVLRSSGNVVIDVAGNDSVILVTELAHELSRGANAVVALAGATPPASLGLAPIAYELAPGIENLTAIVWEHSWSRSFDLIGDDAANRLIGDSFANILVGNGGDDTFFGHGGEDRLLGGSGNDVLNGGDDRDLLEGGDGDDQLAGGAGDDRLVGGSGADQLDGGPGDDILLGGTGDDLLIARLGQDLLSGGAGSDTFLIGHRAEVVVLIGGPGADRFIVEARPGDLVLHFADFLGGEDELDLAPWLGTGRMLVTEVDVAGAVSGWLVTAPERSITLGFATETVVTLDDALAIT